MSPESLNYDSLIEALADGAPIDWTAIETRGGADRTSRRYRNLRLVARVAELHRTLGDDATAEDEAAVRTVSEIPARWGHLEVGSRLASGGFGDVLLARDPELDREVALKLIRPSASAQRSADRLLKEARILARVRHPNVVTVHGAAVRDGRPGLWMELVRGRTLEALVQAGRLGPGEVTAIGVDVCRALAAVHAVGLVHGDVKAQNVMREDGTGRIVLMDFGAGRVEDGGAGAVAGTPLYLAPEALAGEPATQQSDTYSLGVLLFHLLTGQYPYSADDIDGLREAHATGARKFLRDLRPDLPARFVAVVERALERDPIARFTTAGAMEGALIAAGSPPAKLGWSTGRWAVGLAAAAVAGVVVARGAPTRPIVVPTADHPLSIVVLPIGNETGDRAFDAFANGLTDVLISDMSSIRAFRIPSSAAVAPLRNGTLSLASLAGDVHADLILRSSISLVPQDRLQLSAQLVDRAQALVWKQTFTRDRGQALVTTAETARLVAARLSLHLAPSESRSLAQRPIGEEAQSAYLQGLVEANSPSDERQKQAVKYFQRTIDLAPTFAPAWANVALARLTVADGSSSAARAAMIPDIRNAALRAIELDPSCAEAYTALGAVQFYYDWDFPAAEASLSRAVELRPSYSLGRQRYAMFLAAMGRLDEAVDQAAEGRRVDALVPNRIASYAFVYYYKRDHERAVREMNKALAIDPAYAVAHFGLGRIASAQGDQSRAIREIRAALAAGTRPKPSWLVELARVYAQAGQAADSQRALSELQAAADAGEFGGGADTRAYVAAAAGRLDEAFRDLDEAVNQRVTNVLWIAVDPRADPLRKDPRFARLLRRIGL